LTVRLKLLSNLKSTLAGRLFQTLTTRWLKKVDPSIHPSVRAWNSRSITRISPNLMDMFNVSLATGVENF